MPRHRCRLSASSLDYDAKQVTRMVPLHRIGANFDEHYWLPFYGRSADMPTDPISIDDTVSCKPAPCWTLFTLAHVRADGCSSACGLDAADEFVVGNLTQSRFAQAWHSDAVLAERVIPFVDQHCWLPLYSMGAFARSEETLADVVADIRGGRIPQTEQVAEVVDHMVDSMIDNPDALLWVAQLREEHLQTYQHGVRVSLYMISLGRHLGFPKEMLESLGLIGMLADVGKTKLPRALLEKPGMLNPAEYSIIKEHVRLGLEALSQGSALTPEVELGIAQHHERLDGSGYPKGLKGNEISIYGRMAAIADSFSALITPRPYANPLAPQDALMSLYQWAGTSFHEPLVEQFVQGVGVFPVGSMVELSSGEVAVVLAQNLSLIHI